jgi:mRNA-degrading endonuclease RelE of RelBE toxin-antitoxin system
MGNNQELVNIDLTPEYRNNIKKLAKKYRNIRSDTQGVIEELQHGSVLGDRLSGFGDNLFVYKLRAKNSNIQIRKKWWVSHYLFSRIRNQHFIVDNL